MCACLYLFARMQTIAHARLPVDAEKIQVTLCSANTNENSQTQIP